MIRDLYLDRILSEKIRRENTEERATRKSSGKLSASMLGLPVQWQILKHYGVPEVEPDDFLLRKFQRGKDVEVWLMAHLGIDPKKQKFHEYRGVIGYSDSILDTINWDFPSGFIPMEVKSVTKSKFDRVKKDGPQLGHKLQNCFYAMAEGVRKYAMTYINADDYRLLTYICDVEELEENVNAIIDRYTLELVNGTVPIFEPLEDWQESLKYNKYPEWAELTWGRCQEKLKEFLSK